jgi:hypothetical protein
MKRMALMIGVCVCLAAYATAAQAQLVTAGESNPKVTVTTEPKPKSAIAGGTVSVSRSQTAASLEEEAQALMARAKELIAQAAMMKVQRSANYVWSGPTLEQKAVALLGKWKKASESDREAVEKELRGVLKEDFQTRLGKHQKEIEQLEAQVKQLRKKLDLRTSKQDEIIDFRVQQLLREAQGLGWGPESATPARGPSAGPYGVPSSSYVPEGPVPPPYYQPGPIAPPSPAPPALVPLR